MGDFKQALEYLQPAVELWPAECAYQSGLGWALYKQSPSDLEAARGHLEYALELDGNDAITHFRYGMVMRALGDHPLADKHLGLAKQLDPQIE